MVISLCRHEKSVCGVERLTFFLKKDDYNECGYFSELVWLAELL
jgi:hypothetical protein